MAEASRKPLEADVLQWFVTEARELKQAPEPPRRRQPKIARLQSRQQRVAERQTRNPIRAIYTEESKYSETPLAPEGAELTREVGPTDPVVASQTAFGAKATDSVTGAYRHERPQRRNNSRTSQVRRSQADWDAFAEQYEI